MKLYKSTVVFLVSLMPVLSFAADDISTAMAPVQTQIIAYITAAAGMGVAIMAVALGWDVGMNVFRKFFKKGSR